MSITSSFRSLASAKPWQNFNAVQGAQPPTPTAKAGTVDINEKLGEALNAAPISYTAKGLNDYLPGNVKGATDTTLNKLTNWTAKPVTLSADYWNTELANTLKPMEKAYGLAHEQMRGDQALGGTINDSEGYRGTEQLATDYLTQIGQATSGVQQAREKEYVASQQWAQEQGLAGAQAAGTMGTNLSQLYGTTGTEESKLGVTTALQNKAADVNLIGAGLDYSTQNHASNVDIYKAQLVAKAEAEGHAIDEYTARAQAEDAVRQREIDYLNLEGYGNEDMYSTVGEQYGGAGPSTAPLQVGERATPQEGQTMNWGGTTYIWRNHRWVKQ